MSPKRKKSKKKAPRQLSRIILIAGLGSIVIGLLILISTFLPVISVEIRYTIMQRTPKHTSDSQKPVNAAFGIVIPKIGANAVIIPNVDPYDSSIYQRALAKGIAHAKGSVFPGRVGNMFLFSHSSVNFYEALRYNSVFYLLNKLETGDEIYIYMNSTKFIYRVIEKKLVEPNTTFYLTEKTSDKLVTLMTCWPPGTTFKRLIVRAILEQP
ncbi:MAG: sortase [Candidatus Gottesmanbacteria bacterium]